MTDKEQIIIDGVNVSECEFYIYYSSDRYPHRCGIHKDMFGMPACCDVADCCKNCYFKQLQKEKFENLNNRQMVESAENLIYENSELYKNIKEKEQECEELKAQLNDMACMDDDNVLCYPRQELKKECERYKQALDEIAEHYEKVIKNLTTYDEVYDANISIEALHNISDIINKTKDGKND